MLKNKLKNKELTIGSWISLANNSIAEILANAGFDWLVVDLEHSTISINQAGDLIRTIDLAGGTPLVRLTNNDDNQIKRVLDAGAHGIIVPMVNNVDDAIRAVSSSRYPPDGTRGVGLARAQGYGANFNSYFSSQSKGDEGPVVIVQIEHIDALKNISEIFKIPEIDGFIIGPYDLSCSMGIPGDFDNKEFLDVINQIREAAKNIGMPAGIHIVEPDINKLKDALKESYKFIAYSVDIRMLDTTAREGIKLVKNIEK